MDVPGVTGKDVDVTPGPVEGTISVKAQIPRGKEPGTAVFAERGAGGGDHRFERVVPVAWDADTRTLKPEVSNGVLTVTIRKKVQEKDRGRKGPTR